jgi:hypothetical protein
MIALYDLTNPRVAVTPYARKRIREFGMVRPETKRYVAMLVNQSQFSMILTYVATHVANPRLLAAQAFFKQEAAVQWLLARITGKATK